MIHWVRYDAISGEIIAVGATSRAECLPAGTVRCRARAREHWVDHAAVEQMRADHAATLAEWVPSGQPGDIRPGAPDWSACLRARTACPATLVGATDGALSVDLESAPTVTITDMPKWSTVRVRGPVAGSWAYDDGAAAEAITLHQPGKYTVTVTSARHLPAEWVIDAH